MHSALPKPKRIEVQACATLYLIEYKTLDSPRTWTDTTYVTSQVGSLSLFYGE